MENYELVNRLESIRHNTRTLFNMISQEGGAELGL